MAEARPHRQPPQASARAANVPSEMTAVLVPRVARAVAAVAAVVAEVAVGRVVADPVVKTAGPVRKAVRVAVVAPGATGMVAPADLPLSKFSRRDYPRSSSPSTL